jgi:hypothetical protein
MSRHSRPGHTISGIVYGALSVIAGILVVIVWTLGGWVLAGIIR